jgi:hypothetical protein
VAVAVLTPALAQIVKPLVDGARTALVWSPPTIQQPLEIVEVPSPTEEQSPITRLWVGSTNQYAWPILPANAPQIPLPLRSLSGKDLPVLVAQDQIGSCGIAGSTRESCPV